MQIYTDLTSDGQTDKNMYGDSCIHLKTNYYRIYTKLPWMNFELMWNGCETNMEWMWN